MSWGLSSLRRVRTGEALVELLIDRGSIDDLTEARRIVDQWQARRPGIPATGPVVAEITRSAGQGGRQLGWRTPTLAKQYLELCEKLDARGRLDRKRVEMVNDIA